MEYVFETEHLRIRKFVTEDTKALYENHLEEEVKRWIPNESYADFEEAQGAINFYIDSANNRHLPYVLAVELKETGELIGDTGVNEVEGKANEVEIGYGICKKYSGKGYATELLNAMTEFTISTFGIDVLYGRVMRGNHASVRVLEKNGYIFVEEELGAEDDPYGNGMLVYKKECNSNLTKVCKDMNIEIFPLDKVLVGGAAVCLGMEQSAVEAAIGKGQLIGKRCYYFNNEMAIDYSNNKVDFIEFLGGVDGMLKPTIYGISAFETQANDLFHVLKKQNNGIIGDSENGYSYQFEHISVGVYREAVPKEVEEMIEEAASFGNPMSDDEIQYEMKRANHWATIGVGITGYYQR